jgi:hypothetical protein
VAAIVVLDLSMLCALTARAQEAELLPDHAGAMWRLVDSTGAPVCSLPCHASLAAGYQLRLDFGTSPVVISVPDGVTTTPGWRGTLVPIRGIGRPAKLAMEVVGFVLGAAFASLEVVDALDHFSKSRAAPCWGDMRLPSGGCAGATVSNGIDWAAGIGTVALIFLGVGVAGAVIPETHVDVRPMDSGGR